MTPQQKAKLTQLAQILKFGSVEKYRAHMRKLAKRPRPNGRGKRKKTLEREAEQAKLALNQ